MEGAPYPWACPLPYGHLVCPRTPFSCTLRMLVGKNSLYKLPKVLTTVSRKYPLFSFRAVFCCRSRALWHLQAPPRTSFSRGLSTPISRRCCNTHKSLRCVRGCYTSMTWRDQGVPEAWRQSSKLWSSKSSSAKGWWEHQLETKTEDICVIRWSKPLGVYIMNFYRPK